MRIIWTALTSVILFSCMACDQVQQPKFNKEVSNDGATVVVSSDSGSVDNISVTIARTSIYKPIVTGHIKRLDILCENATVDLALCAIEIEALEGYQTLYQEYNGENIVYPDYGESKLSKPITIVAHSIIIKASSIPRPIDYSRVYELDRDETTWDCFFLQEKGEQ